MNVEVIKRLAKKLRRLRHEEHYNQEVYAAKTARGTAACLAGHAVLLGGGRLLYHEGDKFTDTCDMGNGQHVSIEAAARKLLGLNWEQGTPLFADDPSWHWPAEFATRWADARHGYTDERPSRIAADLLNAIANGKVEL